MIPFGIQRPRARLDLLEQFVYFGEREGIDLAERYIEAVAKTCDLLAQHPEVGNAHESGIGRLAGLRRFRVKGFENYLAQRGGVDVVRVLHGARDVGSILAEEEMT